MAVEPSSLPRLPASDNGMSSWQANAIHTPPDTWAPRPDLVCGLWDLIRFQRLVQIRGTRATGKTVLRRLLEHHIASTAPEYEVFVIQGWSRQTIIGRFKNAEGYLQELTGCTIAELLSGRKKIVLLFDEAQDSYWDLQLWIELFKSVDQTTGPFIALFTSFGFAGPDPIGPGNNDLNQVPLHFGHKQLVCLAHCTPRGGAGLGLLLSFDDAMDVITRRLVTYPDLTKFDEDLCHFLISFTDGHVGMLTGMIDILCKNFRDHFRRKSSSLSYNDARPFLCNHRELADELSRDLSTRGMLCDELDDPYYHAILTTMVLEGHLSKSMCEDLIAHHSDAGWTADSVEEHINNLHRRGFIYSHCLRNFDPLWLSEQVWVLPSGCHSWFYAVHMAPSTPLGPPHTSLKDLCITAIRRFNLSRLRSTHSRLGPAETYVCKHGIYHFELYRVLHECLGGRVYPSPQYCKVYGNSVDIMIPHYWWGIRVMVEGREIPRPTAGEGDLADYIALNFRLSRPREVLTGDQYHGLYHVCFEKEFTHVAIYHASNIGEPYIEFVLV